MSRRGNRETTSVWEDANCTLPRLSSLDEDTNADVAIVGAGIGGLTTGYLLAKAGKSVAILDAWGLAAGETSRTTAHLTAVLDDRFYDLESIFGVAGARQAAESHMSAIHRIEAIIREEGIECDFERLDGYLVALSEEQRGKFEKENPAVRRAGFADVDLLGHVPVNGISMVAPTMRFPNQAAFHVLKYMAWLAKV